MRVPRRTLFTTAAIASLAAIAGGCARDDARAAARASAAAAATVDPGPTWVGRPVKPFTLPDADGKSVDLGTVLGKKPVVLIFYRGAWCPFCHAQMAEIAESEKKLRATGAAFYAISNETAEHLKRMRADHRLGWVTFLSDAKGEAASQFAGTYPNDSILKPATIVLRKDGSVAYAYAEENYTRRASSDAILTALKAGE